MPIRDASHTAMIAAPRKRSTWPFWAMFAMIVVLPFLPLPRKADLARHQLWKALTFMFPDAVKGTVEAHGKTMGDFTGAVDTCLSGERRQFFGVSFSNYAHPEIAGRIALPENDQPHVSLDAQVLDAQGHGYAVPFYKDECTVWDVELHRTSSTYNGIWAMAGHARFDCHHDDTGAHIQGNLTFWSCH